MAIRKQAQIVEPPAPTPGPSGMPAPNRVLSVVLQPGEDILWTWVHTPDGGSYVDGYTIIKHADG